MIANFKADYDWCALFDFANGGADGGGAAGNAVGCFPVDVDTRKPKRVRCAICSTCGIDGRGLSAYRQPSSGVIWVIIDQGRGEEHHQACGIEPIPDARPRVCTFADRIDPPAGVKG